jgi:hypothetical protein
MSNDVNKEDSTSCKTTVPSHHNEFHPGTPRWSNTAVNPNFMLSLELERGTEWKQFKPLEKPSGWLNGFALKKESMTKDLKLQGHEYLKIVDISNNDPARVLSPLKLKGKEILLNDLSPLQEILTEDNLIKLPKNGILKHSENHELEKTLEATMLEKMAEIDDLDTPLQLCENVDNAIKELEQIRKAPTGNGKPETSTGTSIGRDDTSSSFPSGRSSNRLMQNGRMPPSHMLPVSQGLKYQQMTSDSDPPISFAIITTSKECSLYYLNHPDLPVDMKERMTAQVQCYQYTDDHYLKDIVKPINRDFSLGYPAIEVNRVCGVLVECSSGCTTRGGSFETVGQLLRTASEQSWPLQTIFVIGSCKVNQVPGQHIPLGTLVFGKQYVEYGKGTIHECHVNFEGRRRDMLGDPDILEHNFRRSGTTGTLNHQHEFVAKNVMSDNFHVHSDAAIARDLGLSDHSLVYENEGTGVITAVQTAALYTGLNPDVVLLKGVCGVVGEDNNLDMDMEYFSERRQNVDEIGRQRMCHDMSLSAVLKMISFRREYISLYI